MVLPVWVLSAPLILLVLLVGTTTVPWLSNPVFTVLLGRVRVP